DPARLSPCLRDRPDLPARLRRKNDRAARPPRPSPRGGRVAKNLRRTAGEIDSLELPLREEAERVPVGRPERIGRSLRCRPRPRLRRIEPAQVEKISAVGLRRHESQRPPVRRKREHSLESRAGGRRNRELELSERE